MESDTIFHNSIFCFTLFIILFNWSCSRDANNKTIEEFILFDFEEGVDESEVKPQKATYKLYKSGENTSLWVTNSFGIKEPGIMLKEGKNQWNFEGYHQVKADVSNVGDEEIQVEMFVGNDPDGLIRWYCSDYVDLKPNESKTITVNISWTPWVHDPQLDIAGMRGVPGKIKTDLKAINEIVFCSRYATQENEFTIDNVRLSGRVEVRDTTGFFPFVNEFGQYVHKEWKDKTHSLEELKALDQRELEDIKQFSEGPERSQYGGWTGGPKLEATGFFRTEKYKNKWWMVDPEGYLFWSAGINCVLPNFGLTGVEGREHYFKDLPAENSEFAQFYEEGEWASHGFYKDKIPFKAYNFYKANLYRKYGDKWSEMYRDRIHKRFDSWGMNTFGNVSDMEAAAQQKTPYVGTVWINGTPKIEGSDGFWGKFHDVFDPRFRKAVRANMESQKQGAGDPWCIGFFVDNEMSWGLLGSLSMGALRSPADQPAKIEFVKDIKKKYGSIETLNEKWQTNYNSWEALLVSTTPPNEEYAWGDLTQFYQKIANTYFRIVKEELNRIAPKQNYLGCRFAWANNEATLRAASTYCDIVSFNKYEYSVENVSLPEGEDKPIMIGEFHFGALDRGSFHVGVKGAKDQTNRGELYQAYIHGALRNPAMVGAHWFQYTDQMITGREDGENYNVGFVDVCDVPYPEFIRLVRETNYGMYEYRDNN